MVRLSYTLLAAAGLIPAIIAQATCYFPNGSPSPNDFVCNSTSDDGFSSCCGTQADGSPAYCMSNGLCLSDMFLSRGSCTDKNYKSKNCAQVCTTTNPSGGVGVRPCGYNGTWDCGDGSGCQTGAIKIPTGTFELTNAQLNQIGAQRIPSSSSSASTPTATAASSSTSSSTTVTATPTGMVPASLIASVGAGVGIPLAVLAVSFLALWLFERRKANRLRQQIDFQHHQLKQAPGSGPSYHHPSVSNATGLSGLDRLPSQHGVVMSPMSGQTAVHGYGQPAMDMQRMVSSSSQHPAYQNGNVNHAYENNAPPPPPPPKAFGGQAWAAEAPGDERHRRGVGSAQELPTDR